MSTIETFHEKSMAALAAGLIKPGEIWIGDARFPQYLVSSHGAVLSFVKRPRILKTIKCGKYRGYTISDASGRPRRVYLHQLVAEVFHGPRPAGMEAAHNDGKRGNNDALNLRWATRGDNHQDKIRHGTQPRGERMATAKLTDKVVIEMRAERERTGVSYKAIAKMFGVTTMTAYRAITGQCWSHVQ